MGPVELSECDVLASSSSPLQRSPERCNGSAHLLTGSSGFARAVAWGESDIEDRHRFPAHEIRPGGDPWQLPRDPARLRLDEFLEEHSTRAFIVLQRGRLVYERYFNGGSREELETSFSVAKSFLSTLVGIAIEEGAISGLDELITRRLPELQERDPRFARIRIGDLLSMSSEIRYEEDSMPERRRGDLLRHGSPPGGARGHLDRTGARTLPKRGDAVEKAKSRDGTQLAFDRIGRGPPMIMVGGAFSWRRWKGFVELADLLSARFTVLNYDRRGRGDSGDTHPYALEREFEDLQAMIGVAGGSASVWGMSSGGMLALEAARAGVAIEKIAAYEPPFIVDSKRRPSAGRLRAPRRRAGGPRPEVRGREVLHGAGDGDAVPDPVADEPVAADVVQAEGDGAHAALRGRHHRPLRPRAPPRRHLLGASRDTDADRKRRQEPGEA